MTDVRREIKSFDWTSIEPKVSLEDLEACNMGIEEAKEEIRRRLRRLAELREAA